MTDNNFNNPLSFFIDDENTENALKFKRKNEKLMKLQSTDEISNPSYLTNTS